MNIASSSNGSRLLKVSDGRSPRGQRQRRRIMKTKFIQGSSLPPSQNGKDTGSAAGAVLPETCDSLERPTLQHGTGDAPSSARASSPLDLSSLWPCPTHGGLTRADAAVTDDFASSFPMQGVSNVSPSCSEKGEESEGGAPGGRCFSFIPDLDEAQRRDTYTESSSPAASEFCNERRTAEVEGRGAAAAGCAEEARACTICTTARGGNRAGRDAGADTSIYFLPRTASDHCQTARLLVAQWISRLTRRLHGAERVKAHKTRRSVPRATHAGHDEPAAAALHFTQSPKVSAEIESGGHDPSTSSAAAPARAGVLDNVPALVPATVHVAGGTSSTREPTATPKASPRSDVMPIFSLNFASSGSGFIPPPDCAPPIRPSTPPSLSCTSSSEDGEATPVAESPREPAADSAQFGDLELVPSDASSLPSLLHTLREIALRCTSMDTFAKSMGQGSGAHTALEEAASGDTVRVRVQQPRGEREPAHRVGDDKSHHAAPPTAVIPPLVTVVTERRSTDEAEEAFEECNEEWNIVRSHFAMVQRLVLNDKELAEALDSTLGMGWRLESMDVVGRDLDEAAREKGGETATGHVSHFFTTAEVASVVKSSSRPIACATGEAENEKHSEQDMSADDDDDNGGDCESSGITATNSSLNCNAPPFRLRAPFTLSRSSALYSPSQHVTSFLSERAPSLMFAKEMFPRAPCTWLKDDFPSTTNSCGTSSKSTRAIAAKNDVSSNDALCNDLTGPANPLPLDKTGSGDSLPVSSPNTTASPSISFHLESREDMLRRRSAAPHAFYAAASHTHRSSTQTNSCNGCASTPPTNPAAASPLSGKVAVFNTANNLCSANGMLSALQRGAAPRSLPVSPLLSFHSPVVSLQCPYDYILVVDFEATCVEHLPPDYPHEIIEFPVVVVDTHLRRIVAEFHRFVRPHLNHRLSEFCKSLTGIRQEDIDKAAPLEEIILQFERWYRQTIPANARTMFATDGPMDFRDFMYKHSVLRQGVRFPVMFYQWVDVKKLFAVFFNCQQGKIRAMLDALYMPFEGRLHSGLDDARNIARIVIGLLQWGCTFYEIPLSRLPLSSPIKTVNGMPSSILGGNLALPPSMMSTGAASL